MAEFHPTSRTRRALRVGLLVSLALSSACIPKTGWIGNRDPSITMPDTFDDANTAPNELVGLQQGEVFDDPDLRALIDEALAHNQELEIVRQEITVRNAEIIARRGEVLPRLDLGVGVGVERVGRYTSQGASDASDDIVPGKKVPEDLGDFTLAFHASWEIDIWGKLRNATRAARERYLSSIEGRNFLATGIVAEVSNEYYELVSLDQQLAVLDKNIGLLRQGLDMVQLQQQAAAANALAVQRFSAELQRSEARRFDLLQQITETENHLNVLCGRYPQPIVRTDKRFSSGTLAPLDAGLPSQLLVRRPDIRAAERDLEAARLDVKVARARFFPSLSIDAAFGIAAFTPAKLAALPESLLYEVAANLLAPLLNRSAIKAEYFARTADQMKAVVTYERSVLLAFVDVANQLAEIHNSDGSYAFKAQQVDTLHQAVDTSNLLFRAARADYLEVLTTRREALDAELELVEVRKQQLSARIDLYRSLGGGWPGAELPTDTTLSPARGRGGSR